MRTMHKRMMGLAFCIAAFAMSAAAQTNTFPASGNVGIGTTSPVSLFDLSSSTFGPPANSGSSNLSMMRIGYTDHTWNGDELNFGIINTGTSNYAAWIQAQVPQNYSVSRPLLLNPNGGNVGIGTTLPGDTFVVMGGALTKYTTSGIDGTIDSLLKYGYYGDLQSGGNGNTNRYHGIDATITAGAASANKMLFKLFQGGFNNNAPAYIMTLQGDGDVGIGTTAPAYKLDVAGIIRTSSGGIVFPDGSTQTTAFNPTICGGDYAESVDVTGDRTKYEPGDVLVIDPSAPGKFLKSNQPYSTLVTGIYSTKPGTVGRRQTTAKSPDEIPMAVVGIVPIKVSAENGPIKPGDLLVASSTLGRAMKGTDRGKMLGAVVGKALGNLDSGTGVIEVLVTLQ